MGATKTLRKPEVSSPKADRENNQYTSKIDGNISDIDEQLKVAQNIIDSLATMKATAVEHDLKMIHYFMDMAALEAEDFVKQNLR